MALTLYLGSELAFVDEEDSHEGEESHAEEEESVTNPVIPDGAELLWAAGAFFALWALMKFVLLKPILAARAERQNKIQGDRDAADAVMQTLGQSQRDYEDALAGARSEAAGIIDAARGEADAHRVELQTAADAEIAELRAAAQAEINAAREAAVSQMSGDVSSLAVSAAGAVLGRSLDVGSNQATIDAALNGGA